MNRFVRIILTASIFISNGYCSLAQNFEDYKRKQQEQFQTYKGQRETEFREYRDKVNAEYAEFMRKAWTRHETKPAEPMPERPEPPKPVVREPGKTVEPVRTPLPFSELLPVPEHKPLPRPEMPEGPVAPVRDMFEFSYYGTECEVPFDEGLRFRLDGISENDVADAWTFLTNDMSSVLVASCLEWRDELSLCDWGYVSFVGKMTEAYFGDGQMNEARLMQMYILVQSGYMMRIARLGSRLALLFPSENNIWQYPYLTLDGCRFFILDSSKAAETIYLFNHKFPKEQMLSLNMPVVPELEYEYGDERTFSSRRYPEIKANVSVNPNLMDFYRDYPLSNDWDIYARTSLSEDVKSQLYPMLKGKIEGMGSLDAAQRLLNYVQTAFDYKTDGDQFGFEKPFFADELFGYPYCDCEDRSILFSVLVHELLGLEVMLVNYPGHMATAVDFNGEVYGAYFEVDGVKFTICDPTYIGAPVGEAMPQFVNALAKIIRVW